jgi:hypothetical protein
MRCRLGIPGRVGAAARSRRGIPYRIRAGRPCKAVPRFLLRLTKGALGRRRSRRAQATPGRGTLA